MPLATGRHAGASAAQRLRLLVLLPVLVLVLAGGEAKAATVVSTVSAGTYPRALAVDPGTGHVFVTHQVGGAGSWVLSADGAQIGSLASGTFGAAVDPVANRLYLTESSDNSLRVFDLTSLVQVASVHVGPFPYAVAVDPGTNRIYVSSQSSDGIYVVDGATDAVITNIPVPGWPPYGVTVNPDTDRIYVADINGGAVSVIDGASNAVIGNITVGANPNAIVADAATDLVYVTNEGSNSVSVIDGGSGIVVDTIPVGASPQGIAVNPVTDRVYVANTDDGSLSVIDGATEQVVQTIPVGAVPIGVAVNSGTNRVYVSNLQGNTITILDDTPPPPPGFVTRDGTQLLMNGQPYRPIGLNIYNANSNGWCSKEMYGSALDDALTAIGGGKNAMRAWFFQQLATTNGVRDWTAFDRTLATARAHGYKVIATLIDQWGNCGATNGQGYGYKEASWYQDGYTQPDPSAIVSYRDWVAEVVSRYKNDPTILAWQLVNEPEVGRCSDVTESTAVNILSSFASDVSGLIKSIDPNHLVSLGTIGSGQCGTSYTDYQTVMSIATLDLCEYHDYTPSQLIPGDQYNGLLFRINQCNALNKPLLVGELGVNPTDVGGTLTDRANLVDSKLCAQLSAGVAGALLWAWDEPDPYDITPGDPVLDVLAPWSDPAHSCTAPSAPSGAIAAAGGGSAAVSWQPPRSNGGSVIRSYTVTSNPDSLTATVDGGQTSATLSGLSNGAAYTFTVSATNAAGTSTPSAASTAVTPQAGYPTPAAATATASPSAPTTVSTGTDPATTGGTTSSLTVPSGTTGGTVSVTQTGTSEPTPSGYQFGGVQIDITAPAASAANPLTLVFTLTPSTGQTPETTEIYRAEGAGTPTLIGDCSGSSGQALPDPCVSNRQSVTIGGQAYVQLTVLASSASHWNSATPKPGAVTVTDNGYSPQSLTVQPGASVTWSFAGKKSHSATDSTGLGPSGSAWFDSGTKTSGSYGFNFPAAGSFGYKSTVKSDSITGTVVVPVVLTPASGRTTTVFSVIWSSKPLSGYVFDVQSRFRPAGSNGWKSWTSWKTGINTTSATFTPSQGAGTYAFHARMRSAGTGRASGYSPDTTTVSVS